MKYIKSAEVFRSFRKEKAKISQGELAKLLKCNHMQISQWERGVARVPPRCLNLMAKSYSNFPISKYHKEYSREYLAQRQNFIKQEMI